MIKRLVLILFIVASAVAAVPASASAMWKNDKTGWKYMDGDSYSAGWKQIDGSWYYFGNDGYMKTAWIMDRGSWYYLNENGTMATGKVSIKGKDYEFSSNGKWKNNYVPSVSGSTNNIQSLSEESIKSAKDFNWFNYNGNKYFKLIETYYARGVWNIDGDIYEFNKDGVMLKGEYTTASGNKYLFGNDGKLIKCITNPNYELWAPGAITTKSNTDNCEVKLDDSHMMDITDVSSEDSAKDGVYIEDEKGYYLDKTKPKVTIKGRTLYCKTSQSIALGNIKVSSTETDTSAFPNLLVLADSTDSNIAYAGVTLSLEDEFFRNVQPTLIALKPGKATITIDVNGTKTSYDVVITE